MQILDENQGFVFSCSFWFKNCSSEPIKLKSLGMKKKLLLTFIIPLTLLSSGCKTSFRISVTTPAPILLDDKTTKLLIVNNVTEDNSHDALLRQVVQGQQYNGNVIAAEQSVIGIVRSLDDSRYLKGVITSPIKLRDDKQINWNRIDSICQAQGTHGIIEIETFESQAPVGGTILANATGQTNSPLRGWAYINIYIATSHQHVDRLDIHEVYNIPISGNTNPLNLLSDALRKREFYGYLGNSIGYKIGSLFYSKWVWVNREFYNKGSRTLKMAKPLIRSGNWDLAERQLEPGINSPKNKVAGRSKYNMALVYEGQGRLNDAITMAERAALENGTKLAYNYINVLKRRTNQQSAIVLIKD